MRLFQASAVAFALLCHPFAAATEQRASDASVNKLLEVMQVRQQMAGMIGQVKTMMRSQMQRGVEQAAGKDPDPEVQQLLEDFMDDVAEVVASELDSPALIADLAKAYASVYTEEEVRAQIKFYSSPIGQKVIARGPELMQASISLMQQRMPAMEAKLAILMKELQAKALELKVRKLREHPQPKAEAEPMPDAAKKP
jgi:hypothetical protein